MVSTSQSSISDRIIKKLKQLPLSQQQEVLDYVEFLIYKNQPRKTIWDKIEERIAQLPEDAIAELPVDASENLDHYLYGVPKK